MSGNAFKKLVKGDELSISATAFNTLMDVAQREYGNAGGSGSAGSQVAGDRSICRVLNSSGSAVDRFAVLGINGVAINHTQNANEFLNATILSGVTPTTASHPGKFVITLEPIRNGKIGKCLVAGICAVQVNMIQTEHVWADVADGDSAKLKSANAGTAQILYVESGTGTKWAVVRLESAMGPALVEVVSAESGGGKYSGKIRGLTGTAPLAGNLSGDDLGSRPTADDALILNLNEVGTSTHILTDASNTREKFFNGVVRGVSSDGRWIVTINGFFGGCS